MNGLILWILNASPNWVVGLIFVGIARVVGIQLVWGIWRWFGPGKEELKEQAKRLKRARERINDLDIDDTDEREAMAAKINEEEGVQLSGCKALAFFVVLSFGLTIWFLVGTWTALTGPHNPHAELGEPSFWRGALLLAIVATPSLLQQALGKSDEERWKHLPPSMRWGCIATIFAGFCGGYLALYGLAPQGLHIYWLTAGLMSFGVNQLWRWAGYDDRAARTDNFLLL